MPFWGAGPMNAAALAAELEIERLLVPRAGGVLSALGMIASDRRRDTARTVMLSGAGLTAERIAAEIEALRETIGAGLEDADAEVTYELRYAGQSFELPVPGTVDTPPDELRERFAAEHEERYGYRDPDSQVELVHLRLALSLPGARPQPRAGEGRLDSSRRRARFDGEWAQAEVLRGEPGEGATAAGPCVFELPETTLVLPPGWSATVDAAGTIAARRDR
jgi:N-methylhydantoinase A